MDQDQPAGAHEVPTVAARVANTREQFDAIGRRTLEWISLPAAERWDLCRTNRRWFSADEVHESSVFLYYDLRPSPAAVDRALRVQRICADALGKGGLNPAPAQRLHATILTDIVVSHRRLADSEVRTTSEWYEPLIAGMHPFLVFVLGPHMTPGGIVLECRIHEQTLFTMRAAARRAENRPIGRREFSPRIPTIEYATLGYITIADQQPLERLNSELATLRQELKPIAVPINRVHVSLTVNKKLADPGLVHELRRSRPDDARLDTWSNGSGLPSDPAEVDMYRLSAEFAASGGSPSER